MERLTAIGTGIVGKIAEYTVEPVGRQVGYVFYYNRNLRKLQSHVRDLDAVRESVEHKIVEEERNGRRAETLVINWLTDVNKITGEAKDFLKDEHQAKIKCLYGFCPNLMARHYLSRKSTKLVQDVAELYGKKDFANIAYDLQPEEVCVLSTNNYEAYDSRTSVVKNIMDELRNYNTDMIGVYGRRGVGKTTLLKEIYKQATKAERLFDEVVMLLDLKQNPSIERIQKEIAEKLGLNLHEIETLAGRALHICNRIKEKKTLVILDDVWENIDLEAVGLPRMPTLKILLTSRSKIVLSRDMGTQKEFHLDLLSKEETWSLFQKMAGDIVKKPNIQSVATQVAEKCGGLPLLIVSVARALKNSPLHAWKDTFRRLKRFDGQGLTVKIYSAIEWSYNKLDNEELKSLFILCGVAVGTANSLSIVNLWKYSMGLDLLKNVDTIREAWDALCSLLEQLKDSCLLLDSDDNTRVRMHDLVKEVANGIAFGDQHVLSLSYGSELKEWPDRTFSEKCTMINLNRCNIPKLPDVLQCQELTFFCLIRSNDDSSLEIPCNFFKEMKKLRVLDLTCQSMTSLPSSLQFLNNLRTLCLDLCILGDIALVGQLQNLEILSFLGSKLKHLPKEIGQLIRLRLLDLTGCSQLEVISPNVLSSLKRLEHLRMGNSFNRWEVGRVVSTKRSNANLEELKHLHQLTALEIHIPEANTIPADLFTSKLERFQICIGSVWKWDDVDEALNTLKLTISNELDQGDQGLKLLLKSTGDLYLEGMEGVNNSIVYHLGTEGFQQLKHLHIQNSSELAYNINGKGVFPNLTRLVVSDIDGLRSLLSSSTARSLVQLTHLQISRCPILEDIVSTKGSDDEENMENMFSKLQHLELESLPNLTRFCSRSYMEFPSLEILQLDNRKEIEEMDSKENLEDTVEHCLFDKKDGMPNLTSLIIHRCHGFRFLLSLDMARSIAQLKHLEISKCQVMEQIISENIQGEEDPNDIFFNLEQLELNDLPNLTRFCSGSLIVFSSLKTLKVVECAKLDKFIFDPPNKRIAIYKETKGGDLKENSQTVVQHFICDIETVVLPNLTSLIVHRLDGLSFLLSSSMAKSIVQFRHREISEPQIMEEIVSATGHGEKNLDDMFSKLELLEQNDLPSIAQFGGYIEFPSIQRWNIVECIKLKTVFHPVSKNIAIYKEIEETHSEENLESAVHSFLFDEKSLPVVLRYITSLIIHRCHGLSFLLSSDMARSLVQLKHLEISECQVMEQIISENIQGEEDSNDILLKLEQLELKYLPNLARFSSGSLIVFSSLKTLKVVECAKLNKFIFDPLNKRIAIYKETKGGDLKENRQTVVQHFICDVQTVVLPNLTSLIVHRLDGLSFLLSSSMAKSIVLFRHREISEPQIMEEIVSATGHGEKNLDDMFSKLELLEQNDLPSLAQFGGYIEFPSIQRWNIVECIKLKTVFHPVSKNIAIYKEIDETHSEENLESAVHSFLFDEKTLQVVLRYITRLIIHRCHGLSFLLSYDMAITLVQLKHVEISECQIMKEIVFLEEYSEAKIDMLTKLEHLVLNDLPNLTRFYSGSHIEFPSLETLHLKKCTILETFISYRLRKSIAMDKEIEERDTKENLETVVPYFLFDKKVGFPKLERMILHQCHSFSFLLSSDMARSLVQLKHVEISECQIMKEIVFLEECSEANIDDMLPKIEHLVLNDLPNLTRFCSGSHIEFPSLERLHLEKCTKLETFISYPLRKSIAIDKEIEERDMEENLETVVPYFLFDKKVGFPKLERLTINDLPKLTKIWGSQLSENSFCKLRDITVQRCNCLIYIVQYSIIARVFQQLQKLTVENCGVLMEIVAQEEGATLMPDQFVLFPEVTCLEFKSLPQLKRFYPRMHALNWPLLKTLELIDCRIVDIFALGFSGLPKTPDLGGLCNPVKQSLDLIEKSSFPNLEDLTLGRIDIWYGPPTPAAFYKQAVFPGISSSDIDKIMPRLKTLRLHGMEKLMRLWEENTEPAAPAFLQLETLEVKFCGLNNIELSAISFKNLTNLEVTFCWRLQYLTTYTVARNLVHLKKLKVDECKSMKEILANDGVGEDASNLADIVFSQLQHLELSDLISLERFCSRNCTVKVPLLETSALVVNWCSLKLKISSDKTLEEVDSNMHLNVQKSHSHQEEAGATTEAADSLETNQKQPASNASEGGQDFEVVIQEMQESTVMQPLNLSSKEGKQFQFQDESGSQLHSQESQHVSKLEAKIRHLQELSRANEAEIRYLQEELLRTREAEMRDKEQKLAEETGTCNC